LTGKDFIEDRFLVELYNGVIDFAKKHQITCYIKEHPLDGLGIQRADAVVIDRNIPVEVLEEEFSCVIGASTTGLLAWPDRSISVLKIFEDLGTAALTKRLAHLQNLPNGDKIYFPLNKHALETAIIKRCGLSQAE
jgi:hypothetical protein